MDKIQRGLVLGAGVGSLTAAIAFAQRGVEVVLAERRPSFDVPGVGLGQPANPLRVYQALDVLPSILASGFIYDHMDIFDLESNPEGQSEDRSSGGVAALDAFDDRQRRGLRGSSCVLGTVRVCWRGWSGTIGAMSAAVGMSGRRATTVECLLWVTFDGAAFAASPELIRKPPTSRWREGPTGLMQRSNIAIPMHASSAAYPTCAHMSGDVIWRSTTLADTLAASSRPFEPRECNNYRVNAGYASIKV
jgi:hypothetical protein